METSTALGRIPTFFLYGEPPHDDVERLLHVETIEFRSSRHHWKIRPHVHRTLHQLIFVLRGRGISHAEGAMVAYRPPAMICVPAGTVHGFDFEPGTHGFVMSMTDDFTREVSLREPAIGVLFKHPATVEFNGEVLRTSGLAQTFSILTREFESSLPGHALALEGLLKVILADALRLSHTSTELTEGAASRRRLLVMRFREVVEGAFRDGWALADYADMLNVSQSRLRKACLGVTEQSPMQIVHARVLLEAKRHLVYTSMSVREIAYALGFDDPAYFTRFFSQRTGMSPRTFRVRGPLT
jgi:AraC family transcriptional activator of pobA